MLGGRDRPDLTTPPGLTRVVSAMAIVIAHEPGRDPALVLTVESEGEVLFPKGRQEPGETLRETAIRELHEEAGIVVSPETCVGHVTRFAYVHERERAYKVIEVFLFNIPAPLPLVVSRGEGFTGGSWQPLASARKRLTHRDARDALDKAYRLVR